MTRQPALAHREWTRPPFGAIVLVFAISLFLLAPRLDERRRGLDDAYITYRYAENLARGHGFVFNVGDPPLLGTSTPLYTALLAAGAILGIDIPLLSICIGVLTTSVALSLVVCMAWEFRLLSPALIVGVIASAARLYTNWEGMETPFYLALILGAIWTAYRSWGPLAFLLAALATVTRLDGLAVLATVSLVLLSERRWSWRTWVPGSAILLSWLLTAIVLFGSPVPSSGTAKLAHDPAISGRFSISSPRLMKQALPVATSIPDTAFQNHPRRATAALAILLAAPLACTIFLRPRRLCAALTSWLILYLAGYSFLGLPSFSWYYGPPAIVLALFVWMGAHAVLVFAGNTVWGRGELVARSVTWIAAVSALLVILVSDPPSTKEPAQAQAGRWLRQHAAPGQTIAAYEVGAVAYLSGLRTVDLLGLTEPRALPHLRTADFAWAIRELPSFVFSNERGRWPVTEAIFSLPEFALNYRPVLRLPFRENLDYVVYRRADPEASHPTNSHWEAQWIDVHHPATMRRGLVAAYSLTVRNLSTLPWRVDTPSAPMVTYDWRDEHGQRVVLEQIRTPLPCDVEPGQRVLVSVELRAPSVTGRYELRWDLTRGQQSFLESNAIASDPATVLIQ
jgi:hypothetical protein